MGHPLSLDHDTLGNTLELNPSRVEHGLTASGFAPMHPRPTDPDPYLKVSFDPRG